MALPYSMGSSGRIEALTEYLKDEATLTGFDIEIESLRISLENGNIVIESKKLDLSKESLNLRIENWLMYHNILDVILAMELAKQYSLILSIRLLNVLMYIIAWCIYLDLIC
jgi:hypothetical protein